VSLNSFNKCLTNNTLWVFISIITLTLYLSPLFYDVFYVPTFDNLDSNIVWYKILAESGLIFSDNNTIIPNMMNGLPRSSYPGEFNVILWLYYFFKPQTAFIINEFIIHLVAFFSMYIFLNRYIVKKKIYYKNVPIFIGALYFSLLPYWSGAGLSIAILPLVTYSLLNIKNKISTKWDWLLLIFLPLYTSFIFLYMFYIIMAGIYLVWNTIKNHQINKSFFLALFLMGTVFLLSEYRLIVAMFSESGFISHRTEFNVYFSKDLPSSLQTTLDFFLHGHLSHVTGLQSYYVLPLVIMAMFLTLVKKRLTKKESLLVWTIILLSFMVDKWQIVFTSLYTLPIILLFSILILLYIKKDTMMPLLLILQIVLAFFAAFAEYKGFKGLVDTFPIFSKLNILRMSFIQPFIWGILIVLAIIVIVKKLPYTFIFMPIFLLFQIQISLEKSFYQTEPMKKYASFEQYYAPEVFLKIKEAFPKPIENFRVVSYGIEPAVALYNGFYTVDGYSTNYPIEYKHTFRKVIAEYLEKKNENIYDSWGSKVHILSISNTVDSYMSDLELNVVHFDIKALCNINTNYLISSYRVKSSVNINLIFIDSYTNKNTLWKIFLYKIKCNI